MHSIVNASCGYLRIMHIMNQGHTVYEFDCITRSKHNFKAVMESRSHHPRPHHGNIFLHEKHHFFTGDIGIYRRPSAFCLSAVIHAMPERLAKKRFRVDFISTAELTPAFTALPLASK